MATQEFKPWEEYQTTPADGQGVEIPAAPEKPEETFRELSTQEKIDRGLDPSGVYQISSTTQKITSTQAPKDLTESESKSVDFYQRTRRAATELERLNLPPEGYLGLIGKEYAPSLTALLSSDQRNAARAAIEDFIAATLRRESGAAISDSEFARQYRIFFPSPNAGPEEIEAKRQARELAIRGLKASSGKAGAALAEKNLMEVGVIDAEGNPIIPPVQRDEMGREIVSPELRVAEGAEFSTEADFQRQRDSAAAWTATQGLPFEQALAQFNETMQAKGYGPASQETIDVLRLYEKRGDRGAVRWELPKTGVREAQAPGRIAAAGSSLVTGYSGGLAEEALNFLDPEAAAKLEAARLYGRENYPGTTFAGETAGALLSPLSRIGLGTKAGTVAGEAVRGGVYGTLYGGGQQAPDVGLLERVPEALIGGTIGAVTGGAAQRVLGGRGVAPVASEGGAGGITTNIPPMGAVAPEIPPVGVMAPEVGPAATTAPAGMAEEVVVEAATMTPQQIGDLARQAVGRGLGATKAKSQLATLAKSNPEAVAAADRLGLELPVDVLSDNAQLRSLTGLARSEVGSEAETAWGETARSVIQRANQAMDELGATADLTQVSADVFKRVDDANESLGKQAGLLREEVEATFNTTDRVEPARIREWLQGRIDQLGGGKEGLSGLSAQEKKLWGIVSKGQPTYARLNEERDLIGQALKKGTGPYADANLARIKQIYGALADDQINFIEAAAGKEIADKQRAANTLFQEMYKGREQMQDIFGKDLSRSLVPLMQRAITSGAKGDISALNQLVSSVPEDMRGTVLTSALFNAAKTRAGARGTEEMFSFTNFSQIYRDLRSNKEVYKQIAKAIGPEGDRLLTDLYAISRRMADAESKVLKTGKANQALDNSLNAEKLLNRVLKGAGARLGAATVGGVAAGPVGVAVAGGLTEGAQYIAQGMGKKNADKVHALLSSEQFRNLIDNVGSGGNVDQAINRVAGSHPFIDYLKSIGVEAKQGKNWLRSAVTVTPVGMVTGATADQEPAVPTPMAVQQ